MKILLPAKREGELLLLRAGRSSVRGDEDLIRREDTVYVGWITAFPVMSLLSSVDGSGGEEAMDWTSRPSFVIAGELDMIDGMI